MLDRETRYCVANSARLSPRARSLTTASRSTSERFTTDPLSLELGAPHAGAHPLDDQIAFQLGDTADDHRDRPTEWPGCINIFPEADELHIQMGQLVENL